MTTPTAAEHAVTQRHAPDPTLLGAASRRSSGTQAQLHQVPNRVAAVLRKARAAEQVASGRGRIPAFRLTRYLIGGARWAGCTDPAIAECLHISLGSVRTRGAGDGWVDAGDFLTLAELSPQVLQRWASEGILRRTVTEPDGRAFYPASELLLGLLALQEPGSPDTAS